MNTETETPRDAEMICGFCGEIVPNDGTHDQALEAQTDLLRQRVTVRNALRNASDPVERRSLEWALEDITRELETWAS